MRKQALRAGLIAAALTALLLSYPASAASRTGSGAARGPGTEEPRQASGHHGIYADGQEIGLDGSWQYAGYSVINTGKSVMYIAAGERKGKTVAVNAGHGTRGGSSKKTYSHPDMTGKVTGGTNSAGAVKSMCVSSGMTFRDGTSEAEVTLEMAHILKERLLSAGYDVLMIRDGKDLQLDNVARTVIANNNADIHIALHWDGDGLDRDKGVFYMSVPDALKSMEPVKSIWEMHERLGDSLIKGLEAEVADIRVWNGSGYGRLDQDLTQTSYSTIPSADIELGNQCSPHDSAELARRAEGLLAGIDMFFGFR